MELTEERIERYSRHILLPEVGGDGQKHLFASSAALAFSAECRGVASVAAVYLASAGLGRIGWWPVDEIGEGALGGLPGGLAELAGCYSEGGLPDSIAALNPDSVLSRIRDPREAVEGFDLLVLLGRHTGFPDSARRFEAAGRPVLRGALCGWSGAAAEGWHDLKDDWFGVLDEELGEGVLPQAAPEGALGAMMASSVLRVLLQSQLTVGSTVQARFDLSRGSVVAAAC